MTLATGLILTNDLTDLRTFIAISVYSIALVITHRLNDYATTRNDVHVASLF